MKAKMTPGAKFRADLERDFEPLDVEQTLVVDQIVALLDEIANMEAVVASDGPTVAGGNGQTAAHPLIAATRQHRVALTRLVAALGLSDDSPGTARARRAATARGRKL